MGRTALDLNQCEGCGRRLLNATHHLCQKCLENGLTVTKGLDYEDNYRYEDDMDLVDLLEMTGRHLQLS